MSLRKPTRRPTIPSSRVLRQRSTSVQLTQFPRTMDMTGVGQCFAPGSAAQASCYLDEEVLAGTSSDENAVTA